MSSVPQAEDRHTEDLRHVGEILGNPEPRYMLKKTIEAVKAAVRIEDVATHYTDAKLLGSGRLLARCIAPDHEDHTPSMTIYTEAQRFRCYGCGLFGDVVDLEQVAGRHLEAWTAVIALSERYGVELPKRPDRWHVWNGEKHRRRNMVRDAIATSYQRRMFRVYGAFLGDIQDEEERRAEASRFWNDLRTVALAAAEYRVSGQ